MSTASVNNMNLQTPPSVEATQRWSLIIGVVFGIISVILAFMQPDKFFHGYLVAYMDWLGVTLGCMALLMVQHLTGGTWGMVIRRLLEAGMRTLPLMIVLFIPVVVGMPRLYFWTRAENIAGNPHLLQLTHSYLTVNGFILRAAMYFAIWWGLAYLLGRYSAQQDEPSARNLRSTFRSISAPGLILYAFTISFAAIDWIMSLSAPWISTIYGMIFMVGECLSALCFIIIVESILSRREPLASLLKPKEVHDHGKLVLTFIMLWAYFSFSQFLIYWAGNLPDEIPWYMRRLYNGWQGVGLFLVIFHFAAPFILLLSRSFKRSTQTMIWLAAWMMLMRYVDLFWYIEPNFSTTFAVNIPDIVLPIAIGGFWVALFFRNLRQRPLLPLYDPRARALMDAAHE